jgi:hypothetical protein
VPDAAARRWPRVVVVAILGADVRAVDGPSPLTPASASKRTVNESQATS